MQLLKARRPFEFSFFVPGMVIFSGKKGAANYKNS